MNELPEEVQKALTALAIVDPAERPGKIGELLKGALTDAQLSTAEGRELLHRRALLVSEIRRRRLLWG